MVLEFLTDIVTGGLGFISNVNPILLLIVFGVFVFVAFRMFQFAMRVVTIGLVAALFPIGANWFLGWDLPVTISSMIWFATMAVGLFILYAILSMVYRFLNMLLGGKREVVVKKEVKEKKE
ncbi:MAG: hypothetical protein KKA90_01040 [Nanoarchaeota archaeon]|nr:hypothetical protein [Nanoarchaeota archaeon]